MSSVIHYNLARLKMIFAKPTNKTFPNSGLILEHIYTFCRDHNSSYSLTKTKGVALMSACSIWDRGNQAFNGCCIGKARYCRAFQGRHVC